MRAPWILLATMRKYAGRIRNTSSGQAIGFSFTIARNNPHCGIKQKTIRAPSQWAPAPSYHARGKILLARVAVSRLHCLEDAIQVVGFRGLAVGGMFCMTSTPSPTAAGRWA